METKTNKNFHPPRHLVWSTDSIDLGDPFQCKWYMKQVLLHGREEDIRSLDLKELARILRDLDLHRPIADLWRDTLRQKGYVTG